MVQIQNRLWLLLFQAKYKEAGKKEASTSLYHLLPETLETQHAKEATELLSEVTYITASLTSMVPEETNQVHLK